MSSSLFEVGVMSSTLCQVVRVTLCQVVRGTLCQAIRGTLCQVQNIRRCVYKILYTINNLCIHSTISVYNLLYTMNDKVARYVKLTFVSTLCQVTKVREGYVKFTFLGSIMSS